ncbi:hypothetical protein Ga0100231_000465 [Opitutaceae bacterium TAV4]|uniref:choice-of-anchor R domain-containing protein n=1 Tax=Geminisphaera colitermitum TaxID=1148786 RepID=UPI0005B846D4|nr:choice-of-anchor R domain-containing protein [Geminisphaera colitermitum]RRK01328.1 hypothetical protein Ga0100231_000465 [Opitutaceae bacterium TAV4]RRK01638.1 hypothetical protein Ga0100230_007300 [Opitutaceae bacterium TAV3]
MKTHLRQLLTLAALTGTLLLASTAAQAATIIGNLDAWTSASGTAATISSTGSKAVGFTMKGDAYAVTSIELRFTVETTAPAAITAEIWSVSANGKLNTAIATLTTSDAITAGTTNNFTFTSTSPVILNSNTTYYIMPRVTSGSLKWTVGNPSVTPTGIGATTIANALYGNPASPTIWNTSTTLNWFKISGELSQVPEPATTAVAAGLGAMLLVLAIRRIKRDA